MTDCEFCDIIDGKSPGSFVYKDDTVLALLTLRPMNRGHTLVIPRMHASSLTNLPEEIGGRLFQVGMDVGDALRRSKIRCEGINFWLADGPVAGQEIFHVHLHVLPRFEDDSVQFDADRTDPSRSEMDTTAEKIQSASIDDG